MRGGSDTIAPKMQKTRRQFLKSAGLGAAALAIPAIRAQGKRPNILVLFTDDQRFSTLNALNNPEVKTPTMDRLMRNGTTFTHAFIMGGTVPAVCMPSRGMLLTGQTLFHVHDSLIAPAEYPETPRRPYTTFPETFRKAGYTTFGTGKWHNGEKLFARSFSTGENIFFGGMSNHLQAPVADFDPTGKYPKEKRRTGEKFSSNLFSDSAIQFLENYKEEKPFLMYVAYTAPHDPRMAPKEYADMYKPENVTVPRNFLPRHPFDNGEMEVRDEQLAPWPRTPQIVREHIAAYYGMITHVDSQMGRVLDALERTGHAKDTIVVFAADNGLAVGQHGLLGKQNLYDHSVRVPLVIGGPGVPQGAKSDSFCYLLDIFPTLCDLTGMPVPASVEGKSLAPLVKDPKARLRDSVFFAYRHVQRGVRTDRWKLIRYSVNGVQTTQLFDIKSDPLEMKNLAAEPSHAAQVREMTALLKQWMKDTGDHLDLDKPDWGFRMKRTALEPVQESSFAE
jgi:arylsulfatase A-like enzyme